MSACVLLASLASPGGLSVSFFSATPTLFFFSLFLAIFTYFPYSPLGQVILPILGHPRPISLLTQRRNLHVSFRTGEGLSRVMDVVVVRWRGCALDPLPYFHLALAANILFGLSCVSLHCLD